MDIYGAVFVRIQDSENDPRRLYDFLSSLRQSELSNIVYPPNRPFALIGRYGRSDNTPYWLPERENPGDP